MNFRTVEEYENYKSFKQVIYFIFFSFMLSLFLGITFLGCTIANAQEIDMFTIAEIESSFNEKACSYIGCEYGRGLYQVSEIVLEEWNNYNKHDKHKPNDLFIGEVNEKIAVWYLSVRIPKMLKYYKIIDNNTSIEDIEYYILLCYNWGIGNVVKYNKGEKPIPKESINYVRKYREIQKRTHSTQ